jgi:hypothetical protein
MNGRLFCDRCRRNTEMALNSGSRFTRAMRAIVAGSGAAVVGALIYFGVTKMTGYELSLMTILIGYVVGIAVRWGSHGRGGWAYQALAVVLTYFAIVRPTRRRSSGDSRHGLSLVARLTTRSMPPGSVMTGDGRADTGLEDRGVRRDGRGRVVIVCIAPFVPGRRLRSAW